MRHGLMESFQMHHTDILYGVASPDRVALFTKAQELGFDGIEFGLGCDYAQDPLWTGLGDLRQRMREVSQQTGVEARSVCLHLCNYREYSLASEDAAHRATGRQILEKALVACREIGASVVLMPFFGTATLRTPEQVDHLVTELRTCASWAESLGIRLALETSLEAPAVVAILERVGSDAVWAYFDTGNAAELGYDIVQEIHDLGGRIAQVHIKDHPRTPVLGRGQIDFRRVVQALQRIAFQDYLVLELPSSDDAATRASLSYLRRMVKA